METGGLQAYIFGRLAKLWCRFGSLVSGGSLYLGDLIRDCTLQFLAISNMRIATSYPVGDDTVNEILLPESGNTPKP